MCNALKVSKKQKKKKVFNLCNSKAGMYWGPLVYSEYPGICIGSSHIRAMTSWTTDL